MIVIVEIFFSTRYLVHDATNSSFSAFFIHNHPISRGQPPSEANTNYTAFFENQQLTNHGSHNTLAATEMNLTPIRSVQRLTNTLS